jgi:hypothetical protein
MDITAKFLHEGLRLKRTCRGAAADASQKTASSDVTDAGASASDSEAIDVTEEDDSEIAQEDEEA